MKLHIFILAIATINAWKDDHDDDHYRPRHHRRHHVHHAARVTKGDNWVKDGS